MRGRKLTDAIDVCLAALGRPAPRVVQAQVRQVLASAYAFAGDTEKALGRLREAEEAYDELGADDLGSITATALANQLMGSRTEADFAEARRLTDHWLEKDRARGDVPAALQSLRLSVQCRWQTFLFAPPGENPARLLTEAGDMLKEGEDLARKLPERQAAKELGGLAQLRGSVRSAQAVADEPEASLRIAAAHYDSGGYAMEAANSRYMIGVIRLNTAFDAQRRGDRAGFLEHFGESETNLNAALAYYCAAAMREEAANARFMLARLYENSRRDAPAELAGTMREQALRHLRDGFRDLDAARREFASGATTDVQTGKLTFADRSGRIVELALEILVSQPGREIDLWNWAQDGKSRALADLLGLSVTAPRSLLTEIDGDARASGLLSAAHDLGLRLREAAPAERPGLRAQLAAIDARMRSDPRFARYLALMKGAPLAPDDLAALFDNGEGGVRAGACVDWIRIGDRFHVAVARPGATARIAPVAISVSAVMAFIANHMGVRDFRETLRDSPSFLHDIDALVAPLAELTAPEDLLILCPTSALHALPLHALTLEGKPLIARNPVVYTHSLGVTRHCVALREKPAAPEPLAVFGDPRGDRGAASSLAEMLAARFGVTPLLRDAATKAAFLAALSRARNVHFQGHAIFTPGAALESWLEFAGADNRLSARDIIGLGGIAAEQISLGACESAASDIRSGDEPLGLVPALHLAGASSIIAALWPVSDDASAAFMSAYYQRVLPPAAMARADAVRSAALDLINGDRSMAAPYHWAAYVLYGDWR
ncbi:CHAT domain-containing protein [Roseiarcus fermentans]|nr:CHAT domain-containing protein [Roseiarcus fermentans]